jgi:S-DNA-T family DNA segregation ATPase FtsK/SpoIIIE
LALGRVLYRHADDVVGLLLIALAAVVGLGVYGDGGGRAGDWLADNTAILVGWQRLAVPVALFMIGFGLIWWRSAAAAETAKAVPADGVEPASKLAHVIVGCTVLSMAAAGFLHLASGLPDQETPATDDDLRDAGGLYGEAIGERLYDLLSTWGSLLVLGAMTVLGLVVLTRTPLRVAAERTLAGLRPLTNGGFSDRLTGMFRLPGDGQSDRSNRTTDELAIGEGEEDGPVSERDPTLEHPLPTPEEIAAAKGAKRRPGRKGGEALADAIVDTEEAEGGPEQLEIALGAAAKPSPWKLPPMSLLDKSSSRQVDRREVESTGRDLEKALAEHGVETRLVGAVVGPTVSRFDLELAPGVKVNRVTSLHKDIAYNMATPDVRILAPVPGKQAIGVEVPNARREIVTVGDILSSTEARKATHPLDVAVGRDITGRSVMMNLASMPHLLIAGATGAGKSSCLNSLLTSVLMRSTPDQVRMILVDPKRVEMGQYDKLPHLLTQVVTDPKKAANALAWAVKEMERRYDLLAEVGFRDINGYNAAVARGELGPDATAEGEATKEYARLAYLLVVIDELADLMMVAARDVEQSIARLAQMARAVGIHLVIATQRPSVNVITGLIKANVPARLAFAVSSVTDSRVVLDQGGAERLIGKGDMLLLEGGSSVPRRLQGAWVTEDEVRKVAGAWKRQAPEVTFDESVQGTGEESSLGGGGGVDDGDSDAMLQQAMELVVRSQLGSTSMLQRKLRVGFARAGRLMDLLEQRGVVGPSEGSKARAVLMTVEELEEQE